MLGNNPGGPTRTFLRRSKMSPTNNGIEFIEVAPTRYP